MSRNEQRPAYEALAALRRNRKARRTLAEVIADEVMFPAQDAGAAARRAVGVDPLTDALIDTTTVAGMGLAQLELDPLVEAYCARLDQKK